MRRLPLSAEILCRACPWGGGRMCVYTCPRAPLTHTHASCSSGWAAF